MTSDTKRKALAFLAGVMILTILIAVALPRLELVPGVPLPALGAGIAGAASGQNSSGTALSISSVWKAIVSLILLAAVIYTGYRLLRGISWSWRDIANFLISIFALSFTVTIIMVILLSFMRSADGTISEEPPPPVVVESGPPLGPVPLGLIWLAGLGLATMMVGLGLWLILRPARHAGSDRLTFHAEWALQALKMGLDLKNVIVRCYWEMGQVLREEQGIEMEAAMTVREFERLLEARGVPHPPVHQLTQLFETVRYGQRAASIEEERRAVDSLTAIAQYSRAKRPPYSI